MYRNIKNLFIVYSFLLAGFSVAFANAEDIPERGTLFGISYFFPDGTMDLGSYAYSESDAHPLLTKDDIILSEKTVAEGWAFAGWYYDFTYKTAITQIEPKESGEKKFYAKLEKSLAYSYSVGKQTILDNLIIYSGESDSDISASIAEKVSPKVPEKQATSLYTFEYDGTWIRDVNSQQFVPSFSKIPKTFNIDFILPENATASEIPKTYTCGKVTNLPNAFLEGSDFVGWQNGLEVVKSIGANEFGDKVFTAVFIKIKVKKIKVIYGNGVNDFFWLDVYDRDSEKQIFEKIDLMLEEKNIALKNPSSDYYLYQQEGWFHIGDNVYVPKYSTQVKNTLARVVYDTEKNSFVTIIIRATDTGSEIEKKIMESLGSKLLPKKDSTEGYVYAFRGWKKDYVEDFFVFTPEFDSTRINVKKNDSEVAVSARNAVTVRFSLEGRILDISGTNYRFCVSIFDLQGRKVIERWVEGMNERIEFSQAGLYLVKVNNEIRRFEVK